MKQFLIILLFFFLFQVGKAQSLLINEIQSSNKETIADEDGEYSDWIELTNTTSDPINLKGWFLSDDPEEKQKWQFPDITLNPNEYILVFASEKNRTTNQLHTNFKLSKKGENLILSDPSFKTIDEVSFNCIPSGFSYGRIQDRNELNFLNPPTPGTTNASASSAELSFIPDAISSSYQQTIYDSPFLLSLSTLNPETKIYFTTNGSEPEIDDSLYTQPITISPRKGEEDVFSLINTSPHWQRPKEEVQKINVIKAVGYHNGCPVTETLTQTFIPSVVATRYNFPIISLNTNKKDLFGKNGIYVEGNNIEPNYLMKGKEWERPISFEYIEDGNLVESTNLGVRINGRYTRNFPQKSLRLYAKEKYGAESFHHQYFKDKPAFDYKRLILKAAATHYSTPFFKDVLISDLIKDLNIDRQAAKPVVVFINGEYWGIHNLTERQDKFFIRNNYGFDQEKINLLEFSLDAEEIKEGNRLSYDEIISFIKQNDLSIEENYNSLNDKLDLNSFIDYYAAQFYLGNYDWPQNNVRLWQSPGEKPTWKPMIFDFDVCMLEDDYDHFEKDFSDENDRNAFLFINLMKNSTFKNSFHLNLLNHLSTTFEPSLVVSKINTLEKQYAPMINEHIYRWGEPETFDAWKANVEELRAFAIKRPLEIMRQLKENFDNPFIVFPNPATESFNIKLLENFDLPITYSIYNLQGQLISQQEQLTSDRNINVENLKAGVYIINLVIGNGIYNEKLIIH